MFFLEIGKGKFRNRLRVFDVVERSVHNGVIGFSDAQIIDLDLLIRRNVTEGQLVQLLCPDIAFDKSFDRKFLFGPAVAFKPHVGVVALDDERFLGRIGRICLRRSMGARRAVRRGRFAGNGGLRERGLRDAQYA